ncbi:septum formation protein Maf [bacterium]|nr:septum formation protein Maf [bacterium]
MSDKDKKRRLYLASASPRRSFILEKYGVPFTIIKNLLEKEPPVDVSKPIADGVLAIASKKAVLSSQFYNGLVLGVDTIVVHDNQVMGKPISIDHAIEGLVKLSGTHHEVLTAYCLVDTISQVKISGVVTTSVLFKSVNKRDIIRYCKGFNPLDKAGGYDIQEVLETFINKIDGSFYNVVGLPIERLQQDLGNYKLIG